MNTPTDQIPPEPPVAPPEPPSVPPPEPEPQASVADHSTDDRNLAMLTHLSGILFCFLVPLIVWLVHKDRSDKAYLVAEAKESLNFQITVLIAYIICWFLMIVVIGAFLIWLVWLANLVFCIMAAMEVSKNGRYRYPFALRLLN